MTEMLIEYVRAWDFSPQSALLIGLIFFVGGFIYIPRTLLCMAVGGIFGPIAIPIIVPCTTLGAVVAFLIARHLIAGRVQGWIDGRPRLRTVADAMDREGWRIVALMRLGGPFPNTVQNYLFGVSRIRLWPYAAATFVFCVPLITLYICIGAAGRMTLDDTSSTFSRAVAGITILCLGTVILVIARKTMVAIRSLPS